MAKDKGETEGGRPTFSETDQNRARQWFKRADELREKRNYDYAIECYVTGLDSWPEAVEEGHMPLRSLAIQRAQAGGKKPGLMDSMKRSMTGRDVKKAMLNAEHLLAMDPSNGGYAEGVLKNATKGGYLATAQWVAPIVYESIRKEKKPSKGRVNAFKDLMVEAAGKANEWSEGNLETFFLQKAVEGLEYAISRMPTDEDLKNEQRDLAGKLTIARGKYEDAEDFRESLQDAEAQKLLHDSERGRQSEQSLGALIDAARTAWKETPESAARLTHYVDALLKTEQKAFEDEAVDVLLQVYEKSKNYNYKSRADDIRLRQMRRQVQALADKARASGSEEDKQQARLAALEQRQVAKDIFRERVAKYPTDLRLKYLYGRVLFEAGDYDGAIPVLQEAVGDPRHRARCQLMIGRAFHEKGAFHQAADELREALESYELTDDHSKELLYWLGRAYEDGRNVEEARATYGKLLRLDYNYRDGDARRRLESLNKPGQ